MMLIERRTDQTLRIVPDVVAGADDARAQPRAGWHVAETAHDLKNLLHGIRLLCEVARRELPDDAPLRRLFDRIDTAGVEAFDLCRDLISDVRPDVDRPIATEPVDLSQLVCEMLPALDVYVSRPGALTCDLAESLPHFDGDPRAVRKLVLNLVKNAVDAIDAGAGCIRIATGVRQGNSLTSVFLEVADTGCGMDADTVVRIFDPLFTTKSTGSGVGLLSVAEAVGACGGSIEISSAPGVGTAVRVLFPCADVSPLGAFDGHRPPARIRTAVDRIRSESDPGERSSPRVQSTPLQTTAHRMHSHPDSRSSADRAGRTMIPRFVALPVSDRMPGGRRLTATRRRIVILDRNADSRADLASAVRRLGHQVVASSSSVREMVQQSLSLGPDLVIADMATLTEQSPGSPANWRVRPRLPILAICRACEQDLAEWCIEHEPLVQAILVRPVKAANLRPAIPLAVQRFAEGEALKRKARQLLRRLDHQRWSRREQPRPIRETG